MCTFASQPKAPLFQIVQQLQAQGLANNQIVQTLQRDGYNMGQINEAMNQAQMTPGGAGQPLPGQMPPPQMGMQPGQAPPPMGQAPPPMGQAPPPMGMPPQGMPPQGMPPQGMGAPGMPIDESSLDNAQFEELAESIIEEKWADLMKNVNKIIDWKNQMESRFVQVEQKFDSLQHNYDELHKAIVGKIGDYDQNILTVGAQVKAMEKVFSKVLPKFTETVNELGRITSFMKDGKTPPKSPSKKEPENNGNVFDDQQNSGGNDDDGDVEIPHELLHNL